MENTHKLDTCEAISIIIIIMINKLELIEKDLLEDNFINKKLNDLCCFRLWTKNSFL